jgi:hypothetical protein
MGSPGLGNSLRDCNRCHGVWRSLEYHEQAVTFVAQHSGVSGLGGGRFPLELRGVDKVGKETLQCASPQHADVSVAAGDH